MLPHAPAPTSRTPPCSLPPPRRRPPDPPPPLPRASASGGLLRRQRGQAPGRAAAIGGAQRTARASGGGATRSTQNRRSIHCRWRTQPRPDPTPDANPAAAALRAGARLPWRRARRGGGGSWAGEAGLGGGDLEMAGQGRWIWPAGGRSSFGSSCAGGRRKTQRGRREQG